MGGIKMPDYDNDDHIKNMHNPEANSYCPNGNPVLEFAKAMVD